MITRFLARLSILAIPLFFLLPGAAAASSFPSDDFNSYISGDTLGGIWSVSGDPWYITDTGCFEGNCVKSQYNTNIPVASLYSGTPGEGSFTGHVTYKALWSTTFGAPYSQTFGLSFNSGAGINVCVKNGSSGMEIDKGDCTSVLENNVTTATWHDINIAWSISSTECLFSMELDGGSIDIFYDATSTCPVLTTGINTFSMVNAGHGADTYIDDFNGAGFGDLTTSNPQTTTNIYALTPVSGSSMATTSSISAAWYVAPGDYVSGEYVHVDLYNQTTAATAINAAETCNVYGAAKCTVDFPITASGYGSGTTTVQYNYAGTVHATYSIIKPGSFSSVPFIGSLFSPSVLFSTSTSYIVGYSSGLDNAITLGGSAVGNYLLTGTTSPAIDLVDCMPTSFHPTACIVSLIFPSTLALQLDFDSLRGGVLQHAPWGYGYRLYEIFAASTTAGTLPMITASAPLGQASTTEILSIDPNDMLAGAAANVNSITDGNGHTIRDVLEPMVLLGVALSVFIIIFHDLTGHRHPHENRGESNRGRKPRVEYYKNVDY